MAETILVVDDSIVSRMMIKEIIKNYKPDAVVVEAGSGDQALEQLTHGSQIDIAIVDYNMPGMNGLEFFRKLELLTSIAKRALLTANIQDEVKQKSTDAGVTFLNKPITEDIIASFISG